MRHTDLKVGHRYIVKRGSHLSVVALEWIDVLVLERHGKPFRRLLYYCRCERTNVRLCFRSARRLRCPYDSSYES